MSWRPQGKEVFLRWQVSIAPLIRDICTKWLELISELQAPRDRPLAPWTICFYPSLIRFVVYRLVSISNPFLPLSNAINLFLLWCFRFYSLHYFNFVNLIRIHVILYHLLFSSTGVSICTHGGFTYVVKNSIHLHMRENRLRLIHWRWSHTLDRKKESWHTFF